MLRDRMRNTWIVIAVCAAILGLSSQPGVTADAKIDLNRASTEELQALPGVGPALAERIVEYREQNGPFQRVEELMNVRGIGEKSFLKLRDRVTVGKAESGKG